MKYDKQNLIDTAKSFARDDFVFFWGHTDRMGGVGKVWHEENKKTWQEGTERQCIRMEKELPGGCQERTPCQILTESKADGLSAWNT